MSNNSFIHKAGFFIIGDKGWSVLCSFILEFGAKNVGLVVVDRDSGVIDDKSKDIINICNRYNIKLFFGENLHREKCIEWPNINFAVGWRRIINFDIQLIVLHDSLLPKYRGFNPLVTSLIEGDSFIGVTAIIASENYDEGNIVAQEKLQVFYPIKIKDAIFKIAKLYTKIVIQIFRDYSAEGKIRSQQQPQEGVSYSPWRDDSDYLIDWSWDSEKIKRFIDATGNPYSGAKTTANGQCLTIKEAVVESDIVITDRARHLGKVIFKKNGNVSVICGQGLLKIIDIVDSAGQVFRPQFRTRFH